jgi:hypothetical protein
MIGIVVVRVRNACEGSAGRRSFSTFITRTGKTAYADVFHTVRLLILRDRLRRGRRLLTYRSTGAGREPITTSERVACSRRERGPGFVATTGPDGSRG